MSLGGDSVGAIKYEAGIDTSGLAADAAKTEAIVKKTGSSIAAAGSSSFKNFANSASTAFGSVASGIANLVKVTAGLAVGGAFGLSSFIKQASELQSVRASFESMTGSAEDASKVLKSLYKFSFSTAFSTDAINQTARLFLGAGVAAADLLPIMNKVGDLAGATGADLKGLALPISQAMAAGKLQTQDWYQILNQGGGVFKKYIIAALGAGHSTKTFSDDLSNGAINAKVLNDALTLATQSGGAAFQGAIKQSQTFDGQLSNMIETIGNVGLSIIGVDKETATVDPSGIFAKLSIAVQDATTWLNNNKQTIIDIANIMINNAIPAFAAITTAFVAAKIAAIGFMIASSPISFTFFAVAAAITAAIAILAFLQVKFGVLNPIIDAVKNSIDWLTDAFNAGNPAVIGLATAIGILFAVMAVNAGIQAMIGGINFITNTTIPLAIAKVAALNAIVSTPMVMPAIGIALALGAIAAVVTAFLNAKAAIENARAEQQADRKATTDIQNGFKARLDSGQWSRMQYDYAMQKQYAVGRATGGSVSSGGVYAVGDNPDGSWNKTTELFVPGRSGTIVNSKDLQGMLGGGQGGGIHNNIQNINISNEVDAQSWLRKLTEVQDFTSRGITPVRGM